MMDEQGRVTALDDNAPMSPGLCAGCHAMTTRSYGVHGVRSCSVECDRDLNDLLDGVALDDVKARGRLVECDALQRCARCVERRWRGYVASVIGDEAWRPALASDAYSRWIRQWMRETWMRDATGQWVPILRRGGQCSWPLGDMQCPGCGDVHLDEPCPDAEEQCGDCGEVIRGAHGHCPAADGGGA